MALFEFGKKKEAKKTPPCCCGAAAGTQEAAAACCGHSGEGIRCIKVLGAGCKSCRQQADNVREAVRALGMSVEVEYITDLEKVAAYGVMSMPAIVVNEKVVSAGTVLKKEGVIALLNKIGGTER